MVARTLYAVDSDALTVTYSTSQGIGETVINNSSSPNGTQYVFNHGYSARQVTLEDTGGSTETFEDDSANTHVITDGAGLVANGTGVEAESLIQVQEMSADGTPFGPVINIYVLSQNGTVGDVWGFVSDTPMKPGANYQKVGGNNIGSTDYTAYGEGWLVSVDGTGAAETMGVNYTDIQGDQIDGTDGQNEIIYGFGGDDTIIAGAGNDTIVGGIGADSIDGAGGTDTAVYSDSDAGVTVDLATGTGTGGTAQGDTLTNIENVTGSDHADVLTGDVNANLLDGRSSDDTLSGGAGDDTLIGGAGADSLDGGTGTDTADYSTSGGAVTVNLTAGTGAGGDAQGDTLTNIENVTGSDFNDAILGDANANVIDGGSGNDTLYGAGGTDTILGGDGNDSVNGGAGADSLEGGAGTDTADYSNSDAAVNVNLGTGTGSGGHAQGDTLSGFENLTGSAHDDTLTGDGHANVFDGGGGRDILQGGAGNDVLTGGAGADSVNGGTGNDWASYSDSSGAVNVELDTGLGTGGDAQGDRLSGIENLWGSAHGDTLTGDANDNILFGDAGADSLTAGAGNDTIGGGAGADVIDGGAGIDTAWYGNSGSGVNVNLTTGTGTGGTAQGDTLTGVENLTGSNYADMLTGDDADNSLSGGAGNDSLTGGDGNDTLTGGQGADSLVGGSGTDTADYSGSMGAVAVDLTTGTGTGSDAQGDTLSSIENVTGSSFDDTLTGSAASNVMTGGAGNDLISSGARNDTIDGGTGNDTLAGGTGNDSMTGGAGDDVFVIDAGSGHDTISDFDINDSDGDGRYNDQLDLSGLTDAHGNPIQIADVVVSDDGFGNALLSFPNGETLLLQGVSPAHMSTSAQMSSAGVPCYAPGTLIDAPEGPRSVESLGPGDLVMTVDHGPQVIRWTRTSDHPLEKAEVDDKPVQIKAGALGPGRPAQDLIVSPQHRIFVGGAGQLDGVFTGEAFAPAKSLTAAPGIRHMKGKNAITWVHFACDRHEVVMANGCLSESLLLGPMVVNGLTATERREVIDIFGPAPAAGAALNGQPARECLKVGPVRRQIAKHRKKKRALIAKEIRQWDRDLAMEKNEADRLRDAS